jgi:type IV secretory pathway VirB10-like protein
MANLDRGAYDSDKLHDFDTDEMDDDTEKSRLPLLVLIALVVLGAFGSVVWLAYTQGVERGRADAPRIIVSQLRPAAPNAAVSPYAGLNIYQPSTPAASTSGNTDSVPPPPTPLAAARPASPPPALRPSTAAKPELPSPVPATASRPAPAPARQRIAQQSAASPPREAEPVRAAPAAQPLATPDTRTPETAPKSAGVQLQIGSYKSDSEAMHSWEAFKTRHSIAATYQPDVQKVDLGGKGTWYRLRLGGLADKKAAIALCEKLKSQGASCLIAR